MLQCRHVPLPVFDAELLIVFVGIMADGVPNACALYEFETFRFDEFITEELPFDVQ